MKKILSRGISVFLLLVFMCSLSVPASASVYASKYLSKYDSTIAAQGNGVLRISVTVIAVETIDQLGASKIVVERNINGSWTPMKTYTNEEYPELSTTNDYVHAKSVLYNGLPGCEYRAEVTVFGNTDYRTFTTLPETAT